MQTMLNDPNLVDLFHNVFTPLLELTTLTLDYHHYRTVPSKRPWGLAAQAPKFVDGRLHGDSLKYPHARAHPGCKVSCHGTEWTCIVSSSVIRRGRPDSGESCIVLQSRRTRSLVAKFPQRSVVACSTRFSCCRRRMLQTRPWTGVCEPLMPDVVSPKVHQNNCSYVSSADLTSDSLRGNLGDTSKLKISVIMTLSLGPPLLASWQK